jgi:type III secretion system YscD/HrpQ family protein
MQRLILKVLTGPNAGAEALLGERTVVGSAETDDIMIGDAALAPGHFTIELKSGAINLVVGDAPLTLKSDAKAKGSYPVAPFDLIKFGSTACAIGPEGAPWPAFSPSDLLPPAAPAPEPVPPAVVAAPAPVEAGATIEDAPKPAPPPGPRRSRLPLIAAAGAVLLIVLGVGGFLLLNSSGDEAVLQVGQATQKIVDDQGAKGVVVKHDDNGGVTVEGFVSTSEQQRRLRQALQAAGLPVKVKVVSLEQQASAVRTLAAAAGARLNVEADPDSGKLVLDGFLPEAGNVDTLLQNLRRDIADLRPIESHIVTAETVRAQVAERLRAAGLEGQATVDVAGNVVRIRGALAEDGRKAAARVANELNERWMGMAKVEDATTAAGAPVPVPARPAAVTVKASPPRAKFIIIVGGKDGFVRDEAGRRYEVGDKLADGEVIEEIRVEEVVTSRDGVRYRYTFGGGK